MKKLYILLLLLISYTVNAQDIKRTAIWYFGENAGIDFNTNPPTALTDGQVNTIEGCASICDTNGNLLFYTDGRTVWNKYHDTMENGTDLRGASSSVQAAIIVPKPKNDSLFYIITTPSAGSTDQAAYFNEVNIYANSGKGLIIQKNQILLSQTGERQSVTKHQNGIDYWLVFHGSGNDIFYSILINEFGICPCPIESKIGINLQGYNSSVNFGTIKVSNNSKFIAMTVPIVWITELFNFNNQTGVLSNHHRLFNSSSPFSLSFSPNDSILYVTERNFSLVQFDISSGIDTLINKSKKIISNYNSNEALRLQLGIGRKIYLSNPGKEYLAVINRPNLLDTLCDFKIDGFDLSPKKSLFGLPDFVSSFFYQPSIDFSYIQDCRTNTLVFAGYNTINATTHKWYFAKGNTTDSANTQTPTYTFTDTGDYTITLIASNGSITDTVIKTLYLYPKYNLNLGNDTTICSTSFTLNAGSGQFCYTWQDSSGNASFEVNQSGAYYVKVVSQNHCTQFDTIKVTVASPPTKPIVTRNNDTLISSTAQSYQWYKNNSPINGAIQQKLKITQNAYYQVAIGDSNSCKSLSDSFSFIYVGLDKIQQQRFVVYPNSAKDHLYITKPKEIAHYKIQILDIQGKQLLAQQLSKNTEEISLITIAEGIYVLKISFADHKTETHKLIITK